MDGYETARRIRRDFPPESQPRIVAVTAAVLEGDSERCFEAGMDDYIEKPIRLEDLARALRDAAAGRPQPAIAAPAGGKPAASKSSLADIDSAPFLDRMTYREMRDRMEEDADEILSLFLEGSPQRLEEIAEGERLGMTDRVIEAAHALKSTSAVIGALRLSRICAIIEEDLRSGRKLEDIALLSRGAQAAFEGAVAEIKAGPG